MSLLSNHCRQWDLAGSKKWLADLAAQDPLVRFPCQEDVGPLLGELPNNGFCLWSKAAWINPPPVPENRRKEQNLLG